MEIIRSVSVRVEVDTNKKTYVLERDDFQPDEVEEWIRGIVEG